jgi:hypothetical protein
VGSRGFALKALPAGFGAGRKTGIANRSADAVLISPVFTLIFISLDPLLIVLDVVDLWPDPAPVDASLTLL